MPGLIETLLKFGQSLLAGAEIENALPDVLELVIQDTKAERGRIELFGQNGDRPFRAAREEGRNLDPNADQISRKILAHVKKSQRLLISADAMDDEEVARMIGTSTTIISQNLRSVACVPLRDEDGVFGVLYIDNRSKPKLFDEAMGEKLQRLADLMARPLRALLNRALEQEKMRNELLDLKHQVDELQDYNQFIGESPEIGKIKRVMDVLKDFDDLYNVLITGETGTGKEHIARMLHRESKRKHKPFIKFDCTGRPRELLDSELFGHAKGAFTHAVKSSPGHIGKAEGGTLFLDEVGNLTLDVQVKLLHFLNNKTYTPVGMTEERQADVWLIMATNKDLKLLMEEDKLMEDIYYRLDKSRKLHIPPMRQRKSDIPLLATFILKRYNKRQESHYIFTKGFLECLQKHRYPGNFRQLDKYVHDAIFNARLEETETITPAHLPPDFFDESKSEVTLKHLQVAIEDFYTADLPKDYRKRPFIVGLQANPRQIQVDSGGPSFVLHDHLLVSIEKAAHLPLQQAKDSVLKAFERNFILAARARHKWHKGAIAELGLDKSTYIEKLKKHGFR